VEQRTTPPAWLTALLAGALASVICLAMLSLLLGWRIPPAGAQVSWTRVETPASTKSTGWTLTTGAPASGGSYDAASALAAWAEYTCLDCTTIRLGAVMYSQGGTLTMTVDGVDDPTPVATASGSVAWQSIVYTSAPLTQGTHTVRATLTAPAPAQSPQVALDFWEWGLDPVATTTTTAPTTTTTEAPTTTTTEAPTSTTEAPTSTTAATTSTTTASTITTTTPASEDEASCTWEHGGVAESDPAPCRPDQGNAYALGICVALAAGCYVGRFIFTRGTVR
jgi:hypothetical protein